MIAMMRSHATRVLGESSGNIEARFESMVTPLPLKFRVPKMDMYDGSKDPLEHLEILKAYMTLHGFLWKVVC